MPDYKYQGTSRSGSSVSGVMTAANKTELANILKRQQITAAKMTEKGKEFNIPTFGGGVSAPVPIFQPEPEYSEEARKAKWQGTVMLSLVVDETGKAVGIKVTKSLGLGLDEKAIEAVQKWRFKPGTKDGKPVPVIASVEVNFRLL